MTSQQGINKLYQNPTLYERIVQFPRSVYTCVKHARLVRMINMLIIWVDLHELQPVQLFSQFMWMKMARNFYFFFLPEKYYLPFTLNWSTCLEYWVEYVWMGFMHRVECIIVFYSLDWCLEHKQQSCLQSYEWIEPLHWCTCTCVMLIYTWGVSEMGNTCTLYELEAACFQKWLCKYVQSLCTNKLCIWMVPN